MSYLDPTTPPWPGVGPGTDPVMLHSVQELVRAINRLEQTMSAIFPVTGATAATAGAADGYLTIVLPDGTARKIPLHLP